MSTYRLSGTRGPKDSCAVTCSRSAGLRAVSALSRHQGLVHAYEFGVDQLASQTALPLCHPSCDTTAGHSCDLVLASPCDGV